MSGRHIRLNAAASPDGPSRSSRRPLVIAGSAVVVAAAVISTVVVLNGGHAPASVAGADPATRCPAPAAVTVDVTPALAPAVRTVAASWVATQPKCTSVTVRPAPDATAESDLASGADAATLWIPDSSVWAQQLDADLIESGGSAATAVPGPSIASSPLVLVAAAGRHVPAVTPAQLAAALESGTAPFRLPNPLTSAEGVLGLHLLSALQPATSRRTAAQGNENIIGAMVVLSASAVDDPATGFTDLSPNSALFGASEQSVIAANAAAGHPVAAAVNPATVAAALDYPVVALHRPNTPSVTASAATAFTRILSGVTAQSAFGRAGFRDPAGDPIPGAGAVGSSRLTLLPQPTAAETADDLRMWSAATEASHTLAVIDVSGSMDESAGDGQSKIQVAAAAAAAAVSYFPASSAFGLWAFSSNKANGLPYTELAPLRTLSSTSGAVSQRQALITAAGQLVNVVGGSTALYDTALAAFEQVRNTYDPGKVNSVVLMTDGQNEYPSGITLKQLLTTLRAQVDPARPVPIITIGIGRAADIATLRQISAATGGKTYSVTDPAAIRSVFLDAMLQRQCRPTCTGS